MLNQSTVPDYDIEDYQDVCTPEQLKAIADSTRLKVLGLLGERAATTKQLAQALRLPLGTTAHHIRVLEAAGIIKVVRTRQVRAITEKSYGRVARSTRLSIDYEGPDIAEYPLLQGGGVALSLRQALTEVQSNHGEDDPSLFLLAHARLSASEAHRFAEQVRDLARQFKSKAVQGEKMYGFTAGVYLTDWPNLPDAEAAHDAEDVGDARDTIVEGAEESA